MIRYFFHVVCFGLWALFSPFKAISSQDFIVFEHPTDNVGMFSIFSHVGGLLALYEWGAYSGVEVNFGTRGAYHDASHGNNWWTYYCEPIKVGSKKGRLVRRTNGFESVDTTLLINHGTDSPEAKREFGIKSSIYPQNVPLVAPLLPEFFLTRRQMYQLIYRYIHIKPRMVAKVEKFSKKYFKNRYIIGVHYRGTDKHSEAPRVQYSDAWIAIQNHIQQNSLTHFKIFIATDEQAFIDFIEHHYPNRVLYQKLHRSSNGVPLHCNPSSPHRAGKEALIDCLLLSKTNYLIRTSSNLSLWSTFFNPELPVENLSDRYPF